VSALPEGWSVSGTADGVAIQLPPGGGQYATYQLTRDELGVLMEHLVAALISLDPLEAPETLKGLESLKAPQLLEGWAVYVENSRVILDIGPRNPSGLQSLNVEEATALWRSLASAYWLASGDVRALFEQSIFDANLRQVEEEDSKWAAVDDDDESPADGQP
jgi:hypothetical protein